MHVSVVLAAYNEENWIHTALDSLKQQTIPFELIIIDNESTDRTVEIAREYTSLVFSAEKGKLNARNLGVQEASGDVVVMVDADCHYPPTFLEQITKHFVDPSIVMVSGCFYNVDMPYLTRVTMKLRISLLNFFLFYSPGSATAYRTQVFLEAGGYKPVRQPTFTSVGWEELFRFSASITRFGRRAWEPKAYCIHHRPRELCVACTLNGDSALSIFCKEIETGQRF